MDFYQAYSLISLYNEPHNSSRFSPHRDIFGDEISLQPFSSAFGAMAAFFHAAKAGFGSVRASKRGNSNTIKQTTPNKPAEIRQATV
jgi:hypothetical protein